jgi:DNA-binding MarR family transcriptional regulator
MSQSAKNDGYPLPHPVHIEKRMEETLILTLITLGERLKKRRDIISQELGVSTQQWLILLHLANDPNIPYLQKKPQTKALMASELAESLDSSRPNISNILNTLLEKGLIEQLEDGEDRRRKRLGLSARGAELVSRLQPERRFLNELLFSQLSDPEKEQFLRLTERVLEQLDEYLLYKSHAEPLETD